MARQRELLSELSVRKEKESSRQTELSRRPTVEHLKLFNKPDAKMRIIMRMVCGTNTLD